MNKDLTTTTTKKAKIIFACKGQLRLYQLGNSE